MNRKNTAEQANQLTNHNNASVKTAHLFQQKFDAKCVRLKKF